MTKALDITKLPSLTSIKSYSNTMSARPRRAAAEATAAAQAAAAPPVAAAGRKRRRAAAAAAVNYNEDSDPEQEEEEEEEAVAVERPDTMTTTAMPSTSTFNPSAALRRLRARWPGRDQQLIALLSALGGPGDRAPHMLVHGPQATGKTSIVRCALIPKIR